MIDLKYTAIASVILLGTCRSPARHAVLTGEISLQVVGEVACGTSGASASKPVRGAAADCFSSVPLLNENDVKSAATDQTSNGSPLVLSLNASAAARLRGFTAHNIGRHLGIIVNRRMVSEPMIAAPTSQVPVVGCTADEARQLLEAFGTPR